MTWISSSSLADFYKMILRRLPVRVEEHQILESFKTGKRCTVMKFYAICWLCVKTGIHKLTQCELSRCSRRFFAERKQDKLRSTVLGWTLSREGFGLLRWNIWSVSRNSIPFAICTNECYCNLVYYHQRNINERPVLDTEVSILESEIR